MAWDWMGDQTADHNRPMIIRLVATRGTGPFGVIVVAVQPS